jgi:hypothetical protein
MIFPTLLAYCLFHLPLPIFGENNFIVPPAPPTLPVGDSGLTWTIGNTVELQWSTNFAGPLTLAAWQGPRNPQSLFYNLTLLGRKTHVAVRFVLS